MKAEEMLLKPHAIFFSCHTMTWLYAIYRGANEKLSKALHEKNVVTLVSLSYK